MDLGCGHERANERRRATRRDGDIGDAGQRADPASVQRGQVECVVARDRRDGGKFDLGRPARQEDGHRVVMARVAVEDDAPRQALARLNVLSRSTSGSGKPTIAALGAAFKITRAPASCAALIAERTAGMGISSCRTTTSVERSTSRSRLTSSSPTAELAPGATVIWF